MKAFFAEYVQYFLTNFDFSYKEKIFSTQQQNIDKIVTKMNLYLFMTFLICCTGHPPQPMKNTSIVDAPVREEKRGNKRA